MKSFKSLLMTFVVLSSITFSFAQDKNTVIENIKISGNCSMCKKRIEKAGNLDNTAVVKWDKESKTASITYNPDKTNKEEILKRIAQAGYDNQSFLSDEQAYSNLPGCCQYDRELKIENPEKNKTSQHETSKKSKTHECH